MRTFIALELPQTFCIETESLANQLSTTAQGRFLKQDTYHLTLAFLGEIDEATAQKVIEILNTTFDKFCANFPSCQSGIALNAVGLGKFGKSNDSTLFLEIQLTEALSALSTTLREELKAQGVNFDQKKFRPHITLARRANLSKGSLKNLVFPAPDTATKLTFFKSTLTPKGALYKPLYTIDLKIKHFPNTRGNA